MANILLFRDTFARNANLDNHTPTPNGGPRWEYDAASGTYTCHLYGALDGPNTGVFVDARNLYSVPVGVKKWRIQIDLYRGGVDWVGGGFSVHALLAPGPIGSFTKENSVSFGIARRDAGSVQFSVQYNRPASPPGPALVALRSANIEMLGSTGRRFILIGDELAGSFELRLADVATGANEITDTEASEPLDPPTGDGLFTAELAAHIANDTTHRLIGLAGGWAASGVVYFAAADLQVQQIEVPLTGPPCSKLLQVFGDDRVTPLWEASTDPAHEHPYLEEPEDYAEQVLDVAAGSASISTVRVRLVDRAQIAGDQDSGWMTERLSAFQVPDVGGHRCRLIMFDPDGNQVLIIDGPASQPEMVGFSAFEFEIQDTNETARAIRCFDVVGATAPVSEDAAPTTPTVSGTDPGFTWGTEYH